MEPDLGKRLRAFNSVGGSRLRQLGMELLPLASLNSMTLVGAEAHADLVARRAARRT
jgi:hypothetical protein